MAHVEHESRCRVSPRGDRVQCIRSDPSREAWLLARDRQTLEHQLVGGRAVTEHQDIHVVADIRKALQRFGRHPGEAVSRGIRLDVLQHRKHGMSPSPLLDGRAYQHPRRYPARHESIGDANDHRMMPRDTLHQLPVHAVK